MNYLERLSARLATEGSVEAIYLFGSAASENVHENSDIDLAVLVGKSLSLGEELRLRAIAVEEMHRDDVDFVILDHAPPLLRYEVVTRGRRLFARDAFAADMFEHSAIMSYLDTAHLRALVHETLREATR